MKMFVTVIIASFLVGLSGLSAQVYQRSDTKGVSAGISILEVGPVRVGIIGRAEVYSNSTEGWQQPQQSRSIYRSSSHSSSSVITCRPPRQRVVMINCGNCRSQHYNNRRCEPPRRRSSHCSSGSQQYEYPQWGR